MSIPKPPVPGLAPAPDGAAEVRAEPSGPDGSRLAGTRTYPNPLPTTWWRHNRRYLFYVVRELSSVVIAIWMAVFLVEVAGLRAGVRYEPLGGPLFVAFSLVCGAFALLHSYTYLSLAGLIMRIPMGERTVPPRAIVGGAFGLLALATVVIGLLLVWGGVR